MLLRPGWVSNEIALLPALPLFTAMTEDLSETSPHKLLVVVLPKRGSLGIGQNVHTNCVGVIIVGNKTKIVKKTEQKRFLSK